MGYFYPTGDLWSTLFWHFSSFQSKWLPSSSIALTLHVNAHIVTCTCQISMWFMKLASLLPPAAASVAFLHFTPTHPLYHHFWGFKCSLKYPTKVFRRHPWKPLVRAQAWQNQPLFLTMQFERYLGPGSRQEDYRMPETRVFHRGYPRPCCFDLAHANQNRELSFAHGTIVWLSHWARGGQKWRL